MKQAKTLLPADIEHYATVPEHSIPLMTSMSGGEPFLIDNYLFFHGNDWLTGIGYPLLLPGSAGFMDALSQAIQETGASEIYCIAPRIESDKLAAVQETDRFYVLSAQAPIPGRLRNYIAKAEKSLTVTETTAFTAKHRKLWTEFLSSRLYGMNERVAALYNKTPEAMAKANGNLRLLDALDGNGNICACLLLDYTPGNFVSYILGAHSRKYYVPHAMDLLFAKMLVNARGANKRFIHLGLGVNTGILRFKKKWSAVPSFHFSMAFWDESALQRKEQGFGQTLCQIILASPDKSARQLLEAEPLVKPFAMLWRVSKNNRVSWLAGTAHFFCASFEPSFRSLFNSVENVVFEGPLDATFMERVNEAGRSLPKDQTPLLEMLNPREVEALENMVLGKNAFFCGLAGEKANLNLDVRHLLATGYPWYVFFTLWTTFLERLGWRQSVDLEAWHIANDMKKNIIGMENLEEQLESLQSLPAQRAINFFRNCKSWRKRARINRSAYLSGDLEKMMGSSAEFPTRTEHIVSRRDQRFRERMRPLLEKGDTAVFVGSAHLVNLRHMLAEDGFEVAQRPFGLWPKLNLNWRRLTRPDDKVNW